MGRLMQIAIGISLIILASGTVHYVHDRQFSGGGMVALIVVMVLIFTMFKKTIRQPGTDRKAPSGDELTRRIAALERRLTDVQDVMITIDEKLDRLGHRDTISAANETEKG